MVGAGGDLCLPGAIEYQTLHSDTRETFELPPGRLEQAQPHGDRAARRRRTATGSTDRTRHLIFERTPPRVTINFLMSDLTFENGPIRQIPGTQTEAASPPTQADEPEWMRLSTLVGAPAGAGVFRDPRAWHGATPNLSREIRAMPNVEYVAPWLEESAFKPSMPHEIWADAQPPRPAHLRPHQDRARRLAGRRRRHAPARQQARRSQRRPRPVIAGGVSLRKD